MVLISYGLTRREIDVALLSLSGITSKAIASDLCISEKGVKNHFNKIYRKTGVKNRMQFIALILGQANGK